MPVIQIIFGVILLLFSVAITVIVMLQEGHQQSMGAITGGADTFLSKNKAPLGGCVPGKMDEGDYHRFLPLGNRDEHLYVLCQLTKADPRLSRRGSFFLSVQGG